LFSVVFLVFKRNSTIGSDDFYLRLEHDMPGEVIPIASKTLEQQFSNFLADLLKLLGDGIVAELEQRSIAEIIEARKYQALEFLLGEVLYRMDGSPEVHGIVGDEKACG
jgi:hypothetical protein